MRASAVKHTTRRVHISHFMEVTVSLDTEGRESGFPRAPSGLSPTRQSPIRQLLRSKQQHLAGYRLPPVTAMLTLVANSFRVHLEPVDWEFLVRTRRMPSS